MPSPRLVLLLTLIATIGIVENSSASPQDQQAQQTLEQALQALGGSERLRSLKSLFFKGKGSEFRSADLQGPDPSTPVKTLHEETTAVFPLQERVLYEQYTGRHDGSFRWRRWIYAGDERTVIDLQDDFISQVRRDPNAATERARIARAIPHLLLLEAATHASGLRWIGRKDFNGKPHNVIGFPLPNTKTILALFFAADTHLLSKYEYSMDFPGLGDTVIEFVYDRYRRDPGMGHVPGGYRIQLGGKTYREVEFVEVLADSAKAESAFEIPPQMKSYLMPVNEVTQIAKGVYMFVTGGLNPLFVEFKDFVLAVEAPAQHPTLERVPADAQAGQRSG